MIRSSIPRWRSTVASSAGSAGSSIGWVVNHSRSRSSSDGGRVRCGTSSRSSDQPSSSAQNSAGAQAMPPSTHTSCSSGRCANTPSVRKLVMSAPIMLPFQTCSSR